MKWFIWGFPYILIGVIVSELGYTSVKAAALYIALNLIFTVCWHVVPPNFKGEKS